MAYSSHGYLPLSTAPTAPTAPTAHATGVNSFEEGGSKDISDLTGYENTIEELRSYFLNRQEFPSMYTESSLILLLGDPGISRLAVVQLVSRQMGMACIQVSMDQLYNRCSGDLVSIREHYIKLANEASEDKDVILF